MSGQIVPPIAKSSYCKYGLVYSLDENFSYGVSRTEIINIDSNNKFNRAILSLNPETTYYWRSYICMNGVYCYSNVKSFTTVSLSPPVLYAVSNITNNSVLISGEMTSPLGESSYWEYGLEYSQDENFSYGVSKKVINTYSDNKFSIEIVPLIPETKYYCRLYIKIKNIYVYSDVKSFVTLVGGMLSQDNLL